MFAMLMKMSVKRYYGYKGWRDFGYPFIKFMRVIYNIIKNKNKRNYLVKWVGNFNKIYY